MKTCLLVETLLQLPLDPNVANAQPLMQASLRGHVEVVRSLLEAAADNNLADNNGATALIAASGEGHVEEVRCLVDASADRNLTTSHGNTALLCASHRGGSFAAGCMYQPDVGRQQWCHS